MGMQRMKDLTGKTEMVEDDGRAGTWPRQSHGADGARSKHGALARREYDLLASEATEGGPANVGAASSKGGHGALANQEGTETEEEGDETLQRALQAQENNVEENEARGPPEQSRALNTCDRQGGEGGGGPPTQWRAPTARSEVTGGDPRTQQLRTPS